MKSRTSLKMGQVGSKSRSQDQTLEKPFVHSRGHIFSPIILKLGQNICPHFQSDYHETWSECLSL